MNRYATRRSAHWCFFRATIYCTLAFSLSTLLWSGAHGSAAQNNQDVRTLEPDRPPIERELAGGQSHTYQIALTAGQFLHVVAGQRGTAWGEESTRLWRRAIDC